MIINRTTYINLLLTCPLWLFASLFNNIYIANIASIFGVILCLKSIYPIIGKPTEMIRFVRIGGIYLCTITNLSWIIASYLHIFKLNLDIRVTLFNSMKGGLSFSTYAIAIFYVCLFSSLLTYFGSNYRIFKLENKIYNILYSSINFSIEKLISIISFFTFINSLLIFSGVIAMRGILVSGVDEGKIPYWIAIFFSILPVQSFFFALIIFKIINEKKTILIYFLIFTLSFNLFISFTNGRSIFIFNLLTIFYWYIFFNRKKPKFKTLLYILLLYPVISNILLFANFLRGADGFSEWKSKSAIELLPSAFEKFNNSKKLIKNEIQSSTENIASRPLVTIPLAYCIQYPSGISTFTYGENLFNSFIWSIPGPFASFKKEFPIQENLLYKHFKIGKDSDEDTADSIYLYSYTEFSWFGLLIYPILLSIFWYIILLLILNWKINGIFFICSICLFFQSLVVLIGESSITENLVSFRSFIFFCFLQKILFPKDKIIISDNNY